MKTRVLHRQLRGFGLSKRDARAVTAMARDAGITNAEVLERFSAGMLAYLSRQTLDGLAAVLEDDHEP